MNLKGYLRSRQKEIDRALDRYLPKATVKPATLHKAMRYSLFAGGKRLRPILCLAAAEACHGKIENALPLACALECIHTYSLVHDDLPSMDNDDFRRGRPTCHKVFGDGIAVRQIMNMAMSFDHRIIDGMMAGQFLGFIKKRLEEWTASSIKL